MRAVLRRDRPLLEQAVLTGRPTARDDRWRAVAWHRHRRGGRHGGGLSLGGRLHERRPEPFPDQRGLVRILDRLLADGAPPVEDLNRVRGRILSCDPQGAAECARSPEHDVRGTRQNADSMPTKLCPCHCQQLQRLTSQAMRGGTCGQRSSRPARRAKADSRAGSSASACGRVSRRAGVGEPHNSRGGRWRCRHVGYRDTIP